MIGDVIDVMENLEICWELNTATEKGEGIWVGWWWMDGEGVNAAPGATAAIAGMAELIALLLFGGACTRLEAAMARS